LGLKSGMTARKPSRRGATQAECDGIRPTSGAVRRGRPANVTEDQI
jgi:hypothetical protein